MGADQLSGTSDAARASRAPPPLLSVVGLAKSFGATRALRSCSLEVRAGEVHAIVGENGSGKSTLVKVLAGVHRPDGGQIALDGEPLRARRSPRETQQAGIATVFQEVLVVGAQSVLANVWLGSDGVFRTHVRVEDKRRRAQTALGELLGGAVGLDDAAESLSLSERQACCVARALVRDPRVLILDEATSALDVATRDRLFAVLRRRCAQGTAIVFISHRMDEIDELADRVTVLRSGESVATFTRGEATTDDLVRHMTGGEQLTTGVTRVKATRRVGDELRLSTRGLRLAEGAPPIEFALRAGELVGLAGLEGHGQDAFLHALRGAGAVGGAVVAGERRLDSPQRAFDAGIVYVPRDRRSESLFETLSTTENFALPTLRRDGTAGFIAWRRAARRLREYVSRLSIRLADPRRPITALSGGNQQKVIVARWLAARPRVLLLNDPTRGVDLGAKRDLYGVLEQLAKDGIAVVMLSTEVDEHVELMDRVLVFREGTITAEIPRADLSRAVLVGAFFGRAVEGGARGG